VPLLRGFWKSSCLMLSSRLREADGLLLFARSSLGSCGSRFAPLSLLVFPIGLHSALKPDSALRLGGYTATQVPVVAKLVFFVLARKQVAA